MVTLFRNLTNSYSTSYSYKLYSLSIPRHVCIFRFFRGLSRSLAFFFLKVFKYNTLVFNRFRKRRLRHKKLFMYIKPQMLVQNARLNFFQFFFFRKNNQETSKFFRAFEKSSPAAVFYFFIKSSYFFISVYFKSMFPMNFRSQSFQSFSDITLFDTFDKKYCLFFFPTHPKLLFFFFRRFKRRKLRKLFMLLKKHFFFKNVTKKHSFMSHIDFYLFPSYVRHKSILLDPRIGCLFIAKYRTNRDYTRHPLNWHMFDKYNWKRRI